MTQYSCTAVYTAVAASVDCTKFSTKFTAVVLQLYM